MKSISSKSTIQFLILTVVFNGCNLPKAQLPDNDISKSNTFEYNPKTSEVWSFDKFGAQHYYRTLDFDTIEILRQIITGMNYKYFGFKSKCSFHSLDEIMYVESDIIHVEPLSHLTFQSEFEYIKPSLRIGVKYEDN